MLCEALRAAGEFLHGHSTEKLLGRVGQTITEIPEAEHLDKRFIQASFRVGPQDPSQDMLTGRGMFYLTEARKLVLDCTSGHYQVPWGYQHPELTAAVTGAMDSGVVWDNHSNIPGNTIKMLARRLLEAANGAASETWENCGSADVLDTVLLGICTGSVAASSALKIALRHHEAVRPGRPPVFVVIAGNYHGTDLLAQRLRGMWQDYFRNVEVMEIEPNDADSLRSAFDACRGRVAAFLAEPVLMNREAIVLETAFLRDARALCDRDDACLVLDEIQTGFWYPEVFLFRQCGIVPDMLIVGKGMTAGFHPLSALLYKRKYDRLAQYDAISTNGNAPLAAVAGLACLAMIQRDQQRIGEIGQYYFRRLMELPLAFPEQVVDVRGRGLMAGLKFPNVEKAVAFYNRCQERGLWVRAHTYHEGHSTILTKLALLADKLVVDYIVDRFWEILEELRESK